MSEKKTLDPKLVEELKAKYGEVRKVTLGDEVFVMRPASRAEWKRFEEARADETKRHVARENLVRHCVVYPDADGLEAVLDRRPAMIIPLTEKAGEHAGWVAKVEDEKL